MSSKKNKIIAAVLVVLGLGVLISYLTGVEMPANIRGIVGVFEIVIGVLAILLAAKKEK